MMRETLLSSDYYILECQQSRSFFRRAEYGHNLAFPGRIEIEFIAGFGETSDLYRLNPSGIAHACYWYENREPVSVGQARAKF